MKIATDADRALFKHLNEQIAADTPFFWGHLIGPDCPQWSDVSIHRFLQAGLIKKTTHHFEIVIEAVERAAKEVLEPLGSLDDERGQADLLRATDPEAAAFRYQGKWCTAKFAKERYGIMAQQLTRASTQEKGLRGITITRRKAQVSEGKRGQVLVYHAGDLKRLADALDHEE